MLTAFWCDVSGRERREPDTCGVLLLAGGWLELRAGPGEEPGGR